MQGKIRHTNESYHIIVAIYLEGRSLVGIQQEQQAQQPAPQQFQQVPTPPTKKGFFNKKLGPVPLWAIIIVLIVVVAVGVSASKGGGSSSTTTTQNGGTTQPTATPTHTPKWTTVQTFTGNGEKKTAIFSVPDDWKIVWSCTGQNIDGVTADGALTVLVYNSDGSLADTAVNATCKAGSKPTTDNTEEHQSGSVYLDVNATGDWTIQIQELK
jgi:hypothetical protein